MSHPRISVVMPVYNVEAYVAEAVQSVLDQSLADFELLIIDDGGSDDSMAICRGFADPRIRIIAQANRGLAGARNTGIAAARGAYIALLDSDDRWHADKLMLHCIHLDSRSDIGVSYCGSHMIDADGNTLRQSQIPKLHGITPSDILCRNPVGNGSAPVLRRAALDKVAFPHPQEPGRTCWFDENFRQSEDIELWLRLALTSGYGFDGIAPLLTDYRIIAGGLSANVVRQYESWERVMAKTETYAPDFIARHKAAARAYQLRYLARRSVQMGDGGFALALMADSLKASLVPLLHEPKRTLLTLAAACAARLFPPAILGRMAAAWTGAKVVA